MGSEKSPRLVEDLITRILLAARYSSARKHTVRSPERHRPSTTPVRRQYTLDAAERQPDAVRQQSGESGVQSGGPRGRCAGPPPATEISWFFAAKLGTGEGARAARCWNERLRGLGSLRSVSRPSDHDREGQG